MNSNLTLFLNFSTFCVQFFGVTTASYTSDSSELMTPEQHTNPMAFANPRYWIAKEEVANRLNERWTKQWFVCYRAITDSRNERTAVFSIIPNAGMGNSISLMGFADESANHI